jgi:hypothetical protein
MDKKKPAMQRALNPLSFGGGRRRQTNDINLHQACLLLFRDGDHKQKL